MSFNLCCNVRRGLQVVCSRHNQQRIDNVAFLVSVPLNLNTGEDTSETPPKKSRRMSGAKHGENFFVAQNELKS